MPGRELDRPAGCHQALLQNPKWAKVGQGHVGTEEPHGNLWTRSMGCSLRGGKQPGALAGVLSWVQEP